MKAKTAKSKSTKRNRTRAKNCPSSELRKIVDAASFRLFMENGYESTTMRHISEETGFGAGSLYNTFTGKEDILKDIIVTTYTELITKVEEFMDDDVDPLVAMSFPMCASLYAASVNKRYAELQSKAHMTWPIVNAMVDMTVQWELKYLKSFREDITPEIMRRNLMCNAAVMGRYMMQFHEEGPQDCTEAFRMCTGIFCKLFDLQVDNFDEIIDMILNIFSDELVVGMFDVMPYKKE